MARKVDYDSTASRYALHRSAVPWVVSHLSRAIGALPPGAVVVEIGCGTGSHVIALSRLHGRCRCYGFDVSTQMLRLAESAASGVEFHRGDANRIFPFAGDFADLMFCVDAVHHMTDLLTFLEESHRVLTDCGTLHIVTDSEQDLRERSLSAFFPEALHADLQRYPALPRLVQLARAVGFERCSIERLSGSIDIDDDLVRRLSARCFSSLEMISDDALERGLQRVRRAGEIGRKWLSCYSALVLEKRP